MPAVLQYSLTSRLRWHDFGNGWIAYSVATGALRHLDATDAAVLSLLEEGAADADGVTRALFDATGVDLPADFQAGLSVLLDELTAAGFLSATAVR